MKNQLLSLLVLFVLLGNRALAQNHDSFNGGTYQINDSIAVVIGDTLTANLPLGGLPDFSFIVPHKKGRFKLAKLGQIGGVAGSVGSAVGSIGGMTGSLGTVRAGIGIMNTGGLASSVGMAADAIDKLEVSKSAKKLIGKTLVITGYEQDPQSDGFPIVYAIMKLENSNKRYKVCLIQAVMSNEILINEKRLNSKD